MADLKLDILVIPTYNKLTFGIADISTYPDSPVTTNPSITITIPQGFGDVTLPFIQNDFNVYTSLSLGITTELMDNPIAPLPDGVWTLTYSVTPAYENYVTKTFMRTEVIQEKFDMAFMKLDMMECDGPIKKQAKQDLNTIYYFIQGSIAAANNCALDASNTLYIQANKMLDRFIKNNCNCTGNNYVTNYA